MRPVRALTILVACGLALPTVLGQEPTPAAAALCPGGLQHMDGAGLVCPREGGLYEVFNAQLESVGYTHGRDPVPPGASTSPDPTAVASGTSVNCVGGAAGTYHVRVLYARATDDADGYGAWLSTIRSLVGQANKLVDDAAIATGSTASINVKCVSGVVEVLNVVLPTPMASASFSTIVTDLRNMGYDDGKVKYWVFYDDASACTCGGMGHVYHDDSPGVTNLNNGNARSMFAVNFGYNSVRIMLHELGHNLGAVQNSAPHTTGALHCYDGRDTMCYNDGGPSSHLYSTGHCATEVFDCGKDDYFHASPPGGSYLATKWNVGNSVNRFLAFGSVSNAPVLTSLTCPASVQKDALFSCSFVASSGTASGVRYTVAWGDGTTTTVPSSGYVAPGTTQSASKTYSTVGTRTVTVSVVDNNGLTGNSLTALVDVTGPVPTVTLLSCPSSVEEDAPFSCSFQASADASGVYYTVFWGDGASTRMPASGFVAPGTTQSASYAYDTWSVRTGSVIATDSNGGASEPYSTTVSSFADDPAMTLLSCPSSVEEDAPFSCSFRATDGSPGVQYAIAWGDGTTTLVPETGTTTPGVTQTASKAYATPGVRTVSVSAVDTYGHASAPLSANVNAFVDDPVMTFLSCPTSIEEDAPFTCSFRASDLSPGVQYEVAWGDGTTALVPASGTVAPGVTQSAGGIYETPGLRVVSVSATDTYGHTGAAASASINAFADDPVMDQLSCPARVEEDFTFVCSFRATDLSPGVAYHIEWGDGTATRVPATGMAAPGVTQTVSKSYVAPGTHGVSVIAIDSYEHVSAPRTTSIVAFQDDPYIGFLVCPSLTESRATFTCRISARDNSSGVSYTVDWGDGLGSTTIPASGFQAPNSTQTVPYEYVAFGSYTITVQATDVLGHVGPARTATIDVVADATPPTLTVEDPRAHFVYVGCGTARATPVATTGRATWIDTACVRATSADPRSGVDRVEVWVDGVLRATDRFAPYQMEFPVPATKTNAAVEVRSYDNFGNVAKRSLLVDMVGR